MNTVFLAHTAAIPKERGRIMVEVDKKLAKGLIWGMAFSLPVWIGVLYSVQHIRDWL
ncbi:hypothetical protein [Paenibacillus maysiensis]|uniref:hypothetical protein n=1 Tax=Paenibacillus maysiensis TaxID=1155954 RepID=UPI0004AEAB39|nr:hypothetical protein [Paenibacillus maysiensis]